MHYDRATVKNLLNQIKTVAPLLLLSPGAVTDVVTLFYLKEVMTFLTTNSAFPGDQAVVQHSCKFTPKI